MPSTHTYGMAGVGHGYANMNLQGAIYGKQATNIGFSAASGGSVLVNALSSGARALTGAEERRCDTVQTVQTVWCSATKWG
ncbi:hypothetical protein F4820DRAFT_447510 [Hypoxylon rubiginosum]|uniref:Uncharacterized protein n=1 Tax=Hypoxylon rubiginosum TaxID=110542 RepID=A0ACB9Z2Q5_9PEZI|nr:hypothetical protein F4820DRAFT_447510 [Hypoxylon rubiginosum]